MQALLYDHQRLSYVTDYPVPGPRRGEALVRVLVAGICATDLEIIKGYLGFRGVPGHEFVGVVEEAEDRDWVGRRVVGGINAGCGQCPVCLSSGPEHCPHRTVLGIAGRDGAFAAYLTLPLVNLIEVPDNLADIEAVFVEPLAAALRICDQVAVRPSARTAVVGPGRLGLLIAQVLARNGTEVAVFGRSPVSLALAEKLNLQVAGPVEEAADNSFDFVVEATGNPAGFTQSLRLVRPGGTMILKSTFTERAHLDLTKIVVAEIMVVGSRCGPFAPAVRLLAGGAIQVRPLIEAEYPLKEGIAAFAHASRPGAKKILLRP